MTDPFSNFMANKDYNPENRDTETENSKWEEARVKWMMRKLGLADSIKKVGQLWRSWHNGLAWLRFEAFNELYPTFPFLFAASRLRKIEIPNTTKLTPSNYHIHTDPNAAVPATFKKFSRVPFVFAYRDWYNEVAETANGRSIGLVFPRRGFAQGLVIHNDSSETYWDNGLCWVYKTSTEELLYVQPFSTLIESIANSGWRP